MKKLILIAATLLLTLAGAAQGKWGIQGGATFSTLKFDKGSSVADKLETKSGFTLGLTYDFDLLGSLGINTGLHYVGRNVEHGGPDHTAMFKYASLELPLNVKLTLPLPVVHPFLMAGPYLDMGLSAKSGDEKIKFGDELKRFNYGIALGAGVDVLRTIRVIYQYDLGLSSMNTSAQSALKTDVKSRSHRVSVGIMF